MKKWLLAALCLMLVMLGCAGALADPIITDGTYVAYLGEENHLFLVDGEGVTKTLRTAIVDLVGMDETRMYCLTAEGRLYAIMLDGSATNIVSAAPTEEDLQNAASKPVYTVAEDGTMTLLAADGTTALATFPKVLAACRNTTHVYFVEQGTPNKLRRVALNDLLYQAEDVCDAVDAPISLFASEDSVAMVAGDHSLILLDLADMSRHYLAATSQETAAAVSREGKLYRFTLDEKGGYILESAEDNGLTGAATQPLTATGSGTTTPTAAPTATAVPTATPRPTATPKPTATQKPTTSTTEDDGSIHYGARGSAVKKMQKRLIELGYPLDKADGVYGDNTKLAVKLFQATAGYKERNYATKSMLNKLYASSAPVFDPLVEVKSGDSGARVLLLQTTLKNLGYDPGKLDGVFGKDTTAALKSFQTAKKLTATGIGDSNTLLLLYEVPVETPTPTPPTENPPAPPASLAGTASIAASAKEGDVLTVSVSLNTSAIAYSWYMDGIQISGATSPTLTVTKDMEGHAITAAVTSLDTSLPGTVFSNACTVVKPEPVDPPTDEPVDPPTDEPVDPPTDEPVDPPTDEPVDPPTDDPSTGTDIQP